jgi:hypothetical protein
MPETEHRWEGIYCLAWTLLLAAGHAGGQLLALSGWEPSAWLGQALPSLTTLYWLLLGISAAFWSVRALRRTGL